MSNQHRTPPGVPTGGQFAAGAEPRAAVRLPRSGPVEYTVAERADFDLLDRHGRRAYDTLRQVDDDHGHWAALVHGIERGHKSAELLDIEKVLRPDTEEQRAVRLAFRLHEGQVDKLGKPYVGHLARTVARLRLLGYGPKVLAAAWLHDSIEDCGISPEYLLAQGIDADVVHAVVLLTKIKGKSNDQYYREVAADPTAFPIKRYGDVADNHDPDRLAQIEDAETRERLDAKYTKAEELLDRYAAEAGTR